MPILIVAIAAMLIQQTVATTAKLALPAVFPAAAKELGFNPEFVLMLTSANAAFGILVIAGCGGAIRQRLPEGLQYGINDGRYGVAGAADWGVRACSQKCAVGRIDVQEVEVTLIDRFVGVEHIFSRDPGSCDSTAIPTGV